MCLWDDIVRRFMNPRPRVEVHSNVVLWPHVDMTVQPQVSTEFSNMARYAERQGWTIIVHCALESSGHIGDNHARGLAIDWHVEKGSGDTIPLLDQFVLSLRFRWSGTGLYPHWAHRGLHTDMRFVPPLGAKSFWWRDDSNPEVPMKKRYHAITSRDVFTLFG